jgi:hypothetical protein
MRIPKLKTPGRRKPTPQFTWEDLATASLPVLACFLGGASAKWAEGLIVMLLGLLLMLNPPRYSLGPALHAVLLGLVACAGIAFLPASWFSQPEWRSALTNDFGIALPATLSPQPWITATQLVSFFAGLCWLYYACGHEAEVRAARRELRLLAGGIVFIAALAIVLRLAHTTLPFWINERRFGPFPNRNQTANLFALAAIVVLACGHDNIRHRKKGWIFWLLAFAVLIAGIVLNFSRAGIVLVLVGSGVWFAVLVLRSGSKGRIAIGFSALLLLVTALLVFGGETLERFHLRDASHAGLTSDFRWLIFHDTFALLRGSPWCGVGLGNFAPIFAIFRDVSLGQNRALHPESDWLWLAAEIGWPAVALVVAGAVLLLRHVFPFVEGTNQWFRIAALIAALLFALHGLVDVSGHRVGTVYTGILLFGLSLRRPLQRVASFALMNSFRAIGFLLFAIGLAWLIASYRGMPFPGSIGADYERQMATSANVGRQHADTILHATRGLHWMPLDWRLYFLRALGEVGANRSSEALDDFRRARFLEPNSYEVPYQEGLAWMTKQPALTMTAWREALRRAGKEKIELYGRMLSLATQVNPAFARSLEEFGSRQPELALAYLERVNGNAFNSALERLLQRSDALQSLTNDQKKRLFVLWSERGDLQVLAQLVEADPEWVEFAWRGLAKDRASRGDFRGAVELAQRYGEKPSLPEAAAGSASLAQLEKDAIARPNDYSVGFALFHQQMADGRIDDALVTVRRYSERADAPPYVHFLEAKAWAAKGNWERAWNAWQKYERATGR